MKKWFVVLVVLLTAGLLFTACPTETETEYKEVPLDVVDAPAFIIKSATEAYNGTILIPTITSKDDGSFDITVKTRIGGAQTAIYFNDIRFMEKYSLVIDLPANATIKPKRVYAFASRSHNEGAPDWSRAWDSDAVKPGVTAHSGVYTIDNGDTPLPTLRRVENSTQYEAVVLYLFWPNEATGNEDYTFTLKSLKFKPCVYGGKPATPPFITQFKVYLSDDASPWSDTGTNTVVVPDTMVSPDEVNEIYELNIDTSSTKSKWELFNIEIAFPTGAIGKNYEFIVSNLGAYANNTTNKISSVSDLQFAHGWVQDGSASVTTTPVSGQAGAYKVKVSNINNIGGLGVTRVYFGSDSINGNGKTWNGAQNSGDEITRFTVTLNLPRSFVN